MPEHHKINVVRIPAPTVHKNADALELIIVPNTAYQCVVKKGQFKDGDLAIYIPPDSVVPPTRPFEFLWADKEFPDGVVSEKYRRVTVRRFRGEWSEGLLLPITDFVQLQNDRCIGYVYQEGDDVAELLGITHYEEPEPLDVYGKDFAKKQFKSMPQSFMGWVRFVLYWLGLYRPQMSGYGAEKPPKNAPPVYDVESFKNYNTAIADGTPVIVTEKIHGSNGRYMWDGKRMWVGSKKLWKSEKSNCIWRRALKAEPTIESICKEYPNVTFYVEVAPTQKQKGSGKPYDYGTGTGWGTDGKPEIKVFFFDAYDPNGSGYARVSGYWDKERTLAAVGRRLFAPVLYEGPFDLEKIKALVEGKTTVPGATHIREGIVVSTAKEQQVRGLGRVQLKLKSMKFFEQEGNA